MAGFTRGDRLRGSPCGCEVRGITSGAEAGGRTVRASEDDLPHLVRSGERGGAALHRPPPLTRVRG